MIYDIMYITFYEILMVYILRHVLFFYGKLLYFFVLMTQLNQQL